KGCYPLISMNFSVVVGNPIVVTKPPFIRSRYSLRFGKTTTMAPEATAGPAMDGNGAMGPGPSTGHPKLATSTANADYDYYGNVEIDNVGHK
ncbi:hypothetical protein KR009_005759, partial [Drosophila setifemur]